MNSWEISCSQEKDDFLVHVKVEMTKTDCITQKKRCFLKKGETECCLYLQKKSPSSKNTPQKPKVQRKSKITCIWQAKKKKKSSGDKGENNYIKEIFHGKS